VADTSPTLELTGRVHALQERIRVMSADATASALELAQRKLQVDRLLILADAAREFSAATADHERLLDTIARRLCEVVGDYCLVLLASPDDRELLVAALHAPDASAEQRMRKIFIERMLLAEHPLPRHVHDTGEPLLVARIDLEQLRPNTSAIHFEFAQAIGMHSLLIVALRAHGRSIGQLVLVRYRKASPAFDDDDVKLASGLAGHASLALANARYLDAERAAQERYRVMFDTSPQPMFVFDPTTLRFLEVNQAAEAQYGFSHDELLAMTLVDIWPHEDVDRNTEVVMRSPSPVHAATSRHRRRDGAIRDVEIRSHPMTLDGRVSRLVLVNDVTVRLQAERARADAEVRFARLRDSGIIGIFVVTLGAGTDSHISEVNDALLDMVGYSRGEMLADGFRWADLTPVEWWPNDQVARGQIASRGITDLREKQLIRKDGTRIPVLIGGASLAGSDRELIGFVLDLRISKPLDAAIEHLRESLAAEATFRTFLEAAPDAVIVINEVNEIVLVNTQTERMFGYSRAELVGQSVNTLVPTRLHTSPTARAEYHAANPAFTQPRARALVSGIALHGRRKDGSEFPIEVTSTPLKMASGLLVYSLVRDLSERYRAEEQRFRLAAIVDSSADAIIGKTMAGIVTSWNAGAQRMFGFTAAEMIGNSVAVLSLPEHEAEEPAILVRLARGEHVDSFDTVRLRKDGTTIEVSVTISPIRDAAGTLIGASKVARDITARRHDETKLARAKDAVEASNRELEAFSYSVAHDLRAPLRGIMGFSQLLIETYRDKLDADGADWLHEVVASAQKMGLLIDAMLSLARLTRSELRQEPVDVSALVRTAARHLAASDPERIVTFVIEDHVTADLDPALARALVDNLVANAWKFTAHVPDARIELGSNHQHGMRTLFIRDNGAGFDMAHATKLFEPFQRLHAAREFPGTGIGLATVQRIVHRHGGRVSAEGIVGGGATFYFSFPKRTTGAAK
jgi:PAS domain S-box-containing protein